MSEKNELKELMIALNQLKWSLDPENLLAVDVDKFETVEKIGHLIETIAAKLNVRVSKRNVAKFFLPPYSTEKDFDEQLQLLLGVSELPSKAQSEHESEMALLIESRTPFERFLISQTVRPQLKALFAENRVSANFYTRFVYQRILMEDRDYFVNIAESLIFGSDTDVELLLERIGCGDSDLNEEELETLLDLELPYFDEFYRYMKTEVFNLVNEMCFNLENPDTSMDEADLLELYASQLMNTVYLKINDRVYQILAVEGCLHSEKHPDPYAYHFLENGISGRWNVQGKGVCITFSNFEDGNDMFGALLISAVKDLEEDYIIDEPDDVRNLLLFAYENALKSQSPSISFVAKKNFDGEIMKSKRKELVPPAAYGKEEFADKLYRFVFPLTVDCL